MALLSAVATAILAVIIIAMLYFGREIFVPIALAILLSFVLAPVVAILQRCRSAARATQITVNTEMSSGVPAIAIIVAEQTPRNSFVPVRVPRQASANGEDHDEHPGQA